LSAAFIAACWQPLLVLFATDRPKECSLAARARGDSGAVIISQLSGEPQRHKKNRVPDPEGSGTLRYVTLRGSEPRHEMDHSVCGRVPRPPGAP
jgi:hypothetical protein